MLVCLFLVPLNEITVTATADGTPAVGQQYRVSCTVLFPEGITDPIVVEWYGPDGGRLTDGNGVTIGSTLASLSNVTSSIEFNPFRTVHGGRFSCRATVMSQAPPFNISKTADVDIIVTGKLSLFVSSCRLACIGTAIMKYLHDRT